MENGRLNILKSKKHGERTFSLLRVPCSLLPYSDFSDFTGFINAARMA